MAVCRRLFSLLAFILLAVGACAPLQSTPLSALPSLAVTTVLPTVTPIPATATPLPADTPEPTATAILSPTAMPAPTDTPIPPTATSRPPLNGSGGGVIAYVHARDGNHHIYVMNADGSDRRMLTSGYADAYPAWSPDGSKIAFHRHESDAVWSIQVMDAAGRNRQRLTHAQARDANPVWSPDGERIAFSRDGDTWIMNADGSDQRLLMDDPVSSCCLSWSPDGKHITFESERDGNAEIYVMDVPDGADTGGGDLQRLTDDEGEDWWPAWSPAGAPGGQQIAFMSDRDGDWEIYVMDADGSNLRQLTDNEAQDKEPAWSPNGTRIAFHSDRDGGGGLYESEIYVMAVPSGTDADGGAPQRLTQRSGLDWGPAWRPAADLASYRYSIPEQTGDGWATDALVDVGLNQASFVSMMDRLDELDGAGVNSILVARNGKLVFEQYFSGFSYYYDKQMQFGRNTIHHLQSVTKSITSILVGIAIEQGFIDGVEEKLFDFFPEYAHLQDEDKERITLEQMLTMSAGFEWNEWSYPYEDDRNDLGALSRSRDYLGYLLSKPVVEEPGSLHVYNSGLPIALGVLIERTSSLYADKFAEQYLFAPLGIEDYYWFRLPDRHPHTGGGLYLRPRDLLKIGQMVLSDGAWQGKQVVSPEWIAKSTDSILTVDSQLIGVEGVEYGYYWWLFPLDYNSTVVRSIQAQGHGGQQLIILPDFDMVIVFTSSNYTTHPKLGLNEIVESYILPATETPLLTTPEPASSSSPWPSQILDDFGVPMVLVPAGPFVMGSDQVPTNAPPHTVTLDAYYIDQHEITNAQFADFIDEFGNQRQEGAPWLHVTSSSNHLHEDQGTWQPDEGYADHPVVEVTWYGASAYCQWRGARLPSEAEWEKAARGTDERTYPWGEEITCDVTNYRPCSIGESVPVGSYPGGASPYGAHDMAGNVGEWTGDWYDSDYYRNAPTENPPGPASSPGKRIASRGGSWYSGSTYLRTFHRNNEFKPTDTLRNIGFRCVITPEELEQSEPAATVVAPTLGFVSEIDAYLASPEQQNAFTGSVLVARDGEVLLAQGYGLADRDTGEPNTPQTRFRICSVTKQFTAMAILLLQAQGKLNVRDRVCDYISNCPTAWMGISLHHLLTHTSGIPDFIDLPDYERTKGDPTTSHELISRVKDRPLEFAPGERWSYSNSGYALLGYLIEEVAGRSYAEFIEENIFEPLAMSDSGYDHNLAVLARGYSGEGEDWRDGDYVDASVPYAAGALYSTVEDLYRWDQALYGQALVSQELLDTMFTPFVPSPIGEFGYGWIISMERGRQLIRHGGGGDGFTSMIARYPDDRVTIILLSNRDTTDVGSILSSISREVFDGFP